MFGHILRTGVRAARSKISDVLDPPDASPVPHPRAKKCRRQPWNARWLARTDVNKHIRYITYYIQQARYFRPSDAPFIVAPLPAKHQRFLADAHGPRASKLAVSLHTEHSSELLGEPRWTPSLLAVLAFLRRFTHVAVLALKHVRTS